MEIHPDAYDDPEEDDWVLPQIGDPTLVPDNTSSWLVFYAWHGEPRSRQWPISLAITREITEPWRRGLGIMVRGLHKAHAVGVWTHGQEPRILTEAPEEKNWHEVVARHTDLESGS